MKKNEPAHRSLKGRFLSLGICLCIVGLLASINTVPGSFFDYVQMLLAGLCIIGGVYEFVRPAPLTKRAVCAQIGVCAECNRQLDPSQMITYDGFHVCLRCKPIFLQKLSEGAAIGPRSTTVHMRLKLTPTSLWWVTTFAALVGLGAAVLIPTLSP